MKYILIAIIACSSLYAKTTINISTSRNYGEHIFELGTKYPNISNFRGGSRITYSRDFYKGGMSIIQKKDNLTFSVGFRTTGWYVPTLKTSRDEDFAMGQITTEKGRKFSIFPPFLYDTAHTFSGTLNFADAKAKSVVSEYSIHLGIKNFLNTNRNSGLFLLVEPSYTYFKYILYDVVQFVRRPFFYGPIGIGLSYSHSYTELPIGLGYLLQYSHFSAEFSLQLLLNYFKYRDFHYQRNLNLVGSGMGNGFIYQFAIFIPIQSDHVIKINHIGHRMFGTSHFKTQGGIVMEDILSNFYGNFFSYVTTKESSLDLSFQKTISN